MHQQRVTDRNKIVLTQKQTTMENYANSETDEISARVLFRQVVEQNKVMIEKFD